MTDFDAAVVLWVADANGAAMPLVPLADCPTDGTWEIMHANDTGGYQWVTVRSKIEGHHRLLVVARPIRSGDGE